LVPVTPLDRSRVDDEVPPIPLGISKDRRMRSFKVVLRLAAMLALLAGAGGCGGVDESKFAPTPGSAAPDAPKTPEEVDARTPKTKI
jgi:Zn-dependent protease